MTRVLVAASVILLLSGVALAQPQPTPSPDQPVTAPVVPALEAELRATDLAAGDAAPFDGVLLDEPTMLYYLGMKNSLKESQLTVEARDKAIKSLEESLAMEKQRQINGTWWERYDFKIGLGLGVVVTGLVTLYAVDKLND